MKQPTGYDSIYDLCNMSLIARQKLGGGVLS